MKGWRATVVTVIILLSLTRCCTARAASLSFVGDVMRGAAKSYVKNENGLEVFNAASGGIWRSIGVGNGMQQLRDENKTEIDESTQLAITTLSVCDLGGGVLLPVVQNVVDELIENSLLSASKEAFKLDIDPPAALVDFLSDPSVRKSPAGQKAVKDLLIKKKVDIKFKMNSNLDDLLKGGTGRNSRLLRKITKVKKLFKVAKFAKALGPVFDVINIGMSTYGLVTTAIDCHNGPTCNVGGIVSSSLGILSGIVGIISLAVPFLAPLALILGIAATFVEIFWTPPEPPLPKLDLQEQLYDLNANKMRNLDVFSRMQLNGVNSFLQQGGESINRYIYVVNQGHLPNWMEENIKDPEEKLSGPLTFGFNEKSEYDRNGIHTTQIEVKGQCTDMSESFSERGADTIGPTDTRCEYFQEGNGDLIVNSRYENVGENLYIGPDFYGISQSSQHERSSGNTMYADTDKSKYQGVMVLVPTERVTYRELRGQEGRRTYTTPVRTRGLHIDTERKLREKVPFTTSTHYDDVVAIGDMLNLGIKVEDGGHMVIVNTGNSGRDVLVIDGWVKNLEARLGLNHNTLSFRTISKSIQQKRRGSRDQKQHEIKGIKYNPGDGQVIMLGYDPVTTKNVEHDLGHVHGVGFLGASPFADEITLFALQKDSTNPNDHFTVFKFFGTATYIFDVNNYKSKRFTASDEVHFKILDGSKNCANREEAPLLKVINMHDSAQAKDVQYKGNTVYIYSTVSNRNREKKPYATVTFISTCPAKVSVITRGGRNIFEKKWIKELDIMYYAGTRFDHDFSVTTVATSRDDIVYLSCPTADVSANNAVTNVKTVVVDEAFFDDCLIGSNDSESHDGEDIRVTWEGNSMRWKFPAKTDEEGSRTIVDQTFTGVQTIVNRFTTEIVTLNRTPFNLYSAFLSKSGQDIVADSELGAAVKDNLNMCILKETNINLMKRNAMERETEYTQEEIVNDCE